MAAAGPSDASGAGVTGVILAGGQSRRLGRDKAVEPFQGQPLIRRVMDRVEQVAQELVVVVADQARGQALPIAIESDATHRVALDRYPGAGSLGGIFSGLWAARRPWALVVSCDMPFLNPVLLRHMLTLRQDADAVVPVVEGRPEPTHALYSKACLPHMESRLQASELKISGFFDQVRVRYLEEGDIVKFDPELLSFFNVNTPEELQRALTLAARTTSSRPVAR